METSRDTSHDTSRDTRTNTAWRCTWHAGPDAGGVQVLPVGRHLLGRGAALGADDPALQPHHALLVVGEDGRLSITQLAGRQPIRLDGAEIHGAADVPDGAWIELGDSLVQCERGAVPQPTAAHIRDGSLVRGPRTVPRWQAVTTTEPAPPAASDERAGGLTPALVGIAGSAVVALVTRQPTFLLFGALGSTVALASWGTQRATLARRRRREHDGYLAARNDARECRARLRLAFRAHHAAAVPTVVSAVTVARHRAEVLWSRRAGHDDAYLASVGLGRVDWPVPDEPGQRDGDAGHGVNGIDGIAGIAVPTSLAPGARLALCGPLAPAVARAVIAQLVTSCGPADLRLIVLTDRPHAWAAVRDLPHATLPDGSCALIDEAGLAGVLTELEGSRAHLLVVTDLIDALATRTGPLRRLLADGAAHALVAVVPARAPAPHLCTAVLTTECGPAARWLPNTQRSDVSASVRVAGIGLGGFAAVTAALRGMVDPEDAASIAAGMPHDLSLVDLHGGTLPTPAAIALAWATLGDHHPRALVGLAADGAVDIDLVRDGPHGLLAGTTGAGKSELLRTMVVAMAANASPTHLTFVLVDYKGGATFDACAALPHVVGVVTDLDDHLAERALRSLHAELRRREAVLRAHAVPDLATLHVDAPAVVLPRLVVVIDEFAALVAEQPAFLHALVGIAQRGRSLGVHLLLATQRPNGVISDDIRANTNLRLALRLQDATDAIDVVGSATPAQLSRRLPGRAVLRLGADDHLTFQAARCTGGEPGRPTPLQVLVRSIIEAARLAGTPAPDAPWRPALPMRLTADDLDDSLPAETLGLVDDPDRQRVLPLTWTSADGHLVLAGSPGSGVTSTLVTLAAHTLRTTSDHLYVIDANGTPAHDALAAHPRCAAVVRLHERERLARLLRHLADPARAARATLIIDGLDTARRALDDVDTTAEYDALTDLLATTDADLTIVAGVQHVAAVPAAFLARCAHRWLLHLHDPHDAAALGLSGGRVPPATPGRIVIVGTAGTDALTAQIVAPLDVRFDGPDEPPVPRIEIVPAMIAALDLPEGRHHDGTTALPLGIELATGRPHLLHVHDGDHVLVTGGARSGRTTALGRLAAAWTALHPTGWVGMIGARRGGPGGLPAATLDELDELDALAPGRPALLVVDDAEWVDDPTGRLAALAASGRVCIIAAGRPDALRQSYGHWTSILRRSRLGLVAAGGGDLDGDLLSTLLPRRTPVAPRPGLMWAVADGSAELVQVATDNAHSASSRLDPR